MKHRSARDAAFLARHRELAREDGRYVSTGRSDLVDIAGEKRGETEKAIKWFDGKRAEWLPKSQIQENDDGTIAMPEWLAKDKGFI